MKSLQDHLADDFRIHLQQISEDFQRLESRIRALARENADLKSNGKSTLSPVAAGKVVFGGDHLQDSLENQFEEAFGSNYQDKLPTIDTTQISTVAKYQHSKTVSRSNSGDLLGKKSSPRGESFWKRFIDNFADCAIHLFYQKNLCKAQVSQDLRIDSVQATWSRDL